MLPPLSALRAFETAARTGSFRRAALELNVTPSAVSHQIKGLEDLLQVALFERTTRRIRLTSEGQAYVMPVREALGILTSATQALARRNRKKRLTVSAAPSFAMGWLMPRLPRLQLAEPDVDIRLSSATEVVDLRTSDVDVAIRHTGRPTFPPGLIAHRLVGEPLMVVCSPALAAEKNLRSLDDLARVRLIRGLHRQGQWESWLEAAGHPPIEPSEDMQVEYDTVAVEAALDGLGVALVADHMVARYLEDGRLVAPFRFVAESTQAYYLLYLEERADDPVIGLFRDWLFSALA